MPVPVDLDVVLLTALLNPVVIVVAFWMGRSADQWQKLPLAAFAASLAGIAAVYVATRLGLGGLAKRAAPRPASSSPSSWSRWCGPTRATGSRGARRDAARLWSGATAIVLAGMVLWTLAPVLVFMALLLAALGLAAAAMIALARRLQAWRERR